MHPFIVCKQAIDVKRRPQRTTLPVVENGKRSIWLFFFLYLTVDQNLLEFLYFLADVDASSLLNKRKSMCQDRVTYILWIRS